MNDVTGRLQRGLAEVSGMGGALGQFRNQARQASQAMKDLNREIFEVDTKRIGAIMEKNTKKVDEHTESLVRLRRQLAEIKRQKIENTFKGLEMGAARVARGLIELNAGILGLSFGFLIDSIKRVYELQERWTKAIGSFNMKIGGMTAGLKGAQRAAVQWSSTIRALTNGDIGEGIEMFGEFTLALGRTVKAGDQFSKLGLQLARGFNMGGGGAGQLVKVFSSLSMTADESAESMKTLIASANAAGVPTNLLAQDLKESSVYMARFGKEGQRTFITGAAFARKFTISIEQLKSAVEGLDAFDEAARTASKLNTAFGTMINSMDLMMEDDPAKRLEMIRQQFLAQGQTFDRLTPKQRRYLAESLRLTEDQVAALLSQTKAGESYADFQRKAEATAKREASAKQLMERQLRATVQTMYAFGAAFDRITVAIANAIRPLLEVLGLAKAGGKDFKSFGQVMESITTTVEHFFNSLAGDSPGAKKWQAFMRTLANDLKRAGAALKDFVFSGGAASLVGKMADGMRRFYTFVRDLGLQAAKFFDPVVNAFFFISQHLGKIVALWAGLKFTNTMGVGNIMNGLGPAGNRTGAGRAAVGGMGLAGGALTAGLLGGGGSAMGAGIGGLVGSFMGPLGQALGPIAGALLGKGLEKLAGLFEQKSPLQEAREALQRTIEAETRKRETMNGILEAMQVRQRADDSARAARNKILSAMEKTALAQKDKAIVLTDAEAQMIQERARELGMFGKTSREARELLNKLGAGSRLTADQLKLLVAGSRAYGSALEELRGLAKQQADLETAKLLDGKVAREKSALESLTKFREMELRIGRDRLKEMARDGSVSELQAIRMTPAMKNLTATQLLEAKDRLKLNKKQVEFLRFEEKLGKMELDNLKDQRRLQELQTDFMKESIGIQLRQSVMGSSEFLAFSNRKDMVGKSLDERFRSFLGTDDAHALVGGQAGLDLLRSGPNIGAISGPGTRPSVAPTPSKEFLGDMGRAYGGSSSAPIVNVYVNNSADTNKIIKTTTRAAVQGRRVSP